MPDNDQQLVAIVPYIGKPPENNLMHGSIPQVMENIPQSVERMERTDALRWPRKMLKKLNAFMMRSGRVHSKYWATVSRALAIALMHSKPANRNVRNNSVGMRRRRKLRW
jgi:hypothetical protein